MMPTISVIDLPLDQWQNRLLKRVFDIVFSILVFLTVGILLFPIIALFIKISSRGSVFFKQERWGLNNEKIICYKFRTMVQESSDIDENGKYQQAKKHDPRITWIGKFLRQTNLDELPQFLNVLWGDMSIVGPRPERPMFVEQFKEEIPHYMKKHLVKAGITGWAQVHGWRGDTDLKTRIEFDLYYIENWSIWLDLKIIALTLFKGILSKNAR